MTITGAGPRICTCGSGPNVARCRAGHLERTRAKPGGRTECPHREDGPKCGEASNVLKTAATLPEAARAELAPGQDEEGIWPAEGPPAHWRDVLGEVDPEGGVCDEGSGCDCPGPPVRYTSDHTATICPRCGPEWCWDVSAAAFRRANEHKQATARKAAREGTASPALPQRELDRQARELAQRRVIILAVVRKVLADRHLTRQCRVAWEWFAEKIPSADAARLAELEEEISEEPVNRHGWWRRQFGTIREYLEWVADDGAAKEEEDGGQADGAEDGGQVISMTARRPELAAQRRQLTALAPQISSGVLCELCLGDGGQHSPAVARIRSSVPGMIPERDVCLQHYENFADLIERMTYASLWIVKQYANAPGVRSIIRPGTPGTPDDISRMAAP